VHLEKEVVSLAHFERLNKYFGFTDVQPLDPGLLATRAVKTPYELERMTASGRIHQEVLEDVVPTLLIQGISEAELGVEILSAMLQRGHHGVTRIGMFDTELFLGQICFGDSSTYPNPFDGPGGVRGLSPAVPLFGSRERTLRRGQIVFVDVGCGVDGYHTDKTMVYAFGDVPDEARDAHRQCVDIQNRIAAELRPGTAPSALYERIVADLEPAFLETFMGAGREQVRFLGHGVGLVIDESPVIAKGFDEPLQENMTLALEPKKALPGIGMVGIENTFRVTPAGGTSLTGTSPGLIQV
jgi:Xaa-Pro aminopeptidase